MRKSSIRSKEKVMAIKKLIEVALPLEKINAASAKEKSIRFGHPSTLHLWWARRPLAAARAVIWASLVDDPSSHPELFPTEKDQNKERQRLFHILENLVVWENSNNDTVLNLAKAEIVRAMGGNPPKLLDPFSGGGAIPLEAQRLGLEARANDLNPVAVMINKGMIEIPPRFANMPPVNPDSRRMRNTGWSGANGLADDVRYYGEWIKRSAYERIGHLYPKVDVPQAQGGGKAKVIAWIWTRTIKCPNPACGCQMPLASTFELSRKKNAKAFVVPQFDYKRKKITYRVHSGAGKIPESGKTSRGAKFRCIMCRQTVSDDYIKQESAAGKMGAELLAIVAEGRHGRFYVSPNEEHRMAANCPKPDDYPDQFLPYDPRNIWCVNYGLDTYDKLFTNRQLQAMTAFGQLVSEAQKAVEEAAVSAGMENDHIPLSEGGKGAQAYGEAICVYLAFGMSRMANSNNSLCRWTINKTQVIPVFARQAIPMVWDYAENNVFNDAAGDISVALENVARAIERLPAQSKDGLSTQCDAQTDSGLRDIMISTDPPYYDNIGYADLSDFFYVWLRRNLRQIYPGLFQTMLVPKADELIASPYRHNGSAATAKYFFEDGMVTACRQMYLSTRDDIPVTIYYAYKQSDSNEAEEGQASSGWETMLTAIIQAGFAITGTWPMRTEMANRAIASGTNALASSIVLVCRKRSQDAPVCTRRNFINELKRELRPALQKLQNSNIAPVDLAQSAIGPGMGVYSKYTQVLEADGTPMTVRSALTVINQELDLYFNEQDGELDSESRFCIDLYSQAAFNEIKFGDANTLATAKNTSVAIMASHGTLYAQKGVVHLIERQELPEAIHEHDGSIWLLCQQLTYRMEKDGVEGCTNAVAGMFGSNAERAKDLAYRLYTIAERKHWAQEAYAYNALVVAWPEIQSRAAELKAIQPEQMTIFDYQ